MFGKFIMACLNSSSSSFSIHGRSQRFFPILSAAPDMQISVGRSKRNTVSHDFSFIYTVISFWRLRRKVSEAIIFRENIYLPFKMDDQNLEHIIAHEKAHIRRKDHWWKPFGFLLLTLHWFNPLMWIAYELACDEKVIKELWLNITYNYYSVFCRSEVFGEGGIRSIYGLTGAESVPLLKKAILIVIPTE